MVVEVICRRTGIVHSDRTMYHEFRNERDLRLALKLYLKHSQGHVGEQRGDDDKSVPALCNAVLKDFLRQYGSDISTRML